MGVHRNSVSHAKFSENKNMVAFDVRGICVRSGLFLGRGSLLHL